MMAGNGLALWDMSHKLTAYIMKEYIRPEKDYITELVQRNAEGAKKKYTTSFRTEDPENTDEKTRKLPGVAIENPGGYYFVNNLQVIVSASDHLRAPPCPKAKEPRFPRNNSQP